MESLSQILEEELENAVEVKDKKSLHRYVYLSTQNIVTRQENQEQFQLLRNDIQQNSSDIRELAAAMKVGFEIMETKFEAVDKRFEAVDKRFEAVDRRFESVDKRFVDLQHYMDRRFSTQFRFLTLGFTIMVVLMSLYNFL